VNMSGLVKASIGTMPLSGFGLVDCLVFVTGLCLGSFGGMLAARLPAREALTGRSRCPECNQTLGPWELIPVFSFLVQRGRCKHCRGKITPGYLAVELSTAVSFFFLHRCFGLGPAGILHMAVAFHLCILAGTDIMYGLIPNKILLSLSGFSLALRLIGGFRPGSLGIGSYEVASLISGFRGAALGFGLLFAVAFIKPEAMGGGDVKMAGAIGLYLGFPNILPGLGLSFFMAAAYCIPLLLIGRLKKTDTIPLGAFFSLATIVIAVAAWPW